jgi:hypothetical protein
MILSKGERVSVFLDRLTQAPPASSGDEALMLLSETLNQVEDELTEITFDPTRWMDDGRMYPPQRDNAHVDDLPDVVRYRSKVHNTRIHISGAIRIEKVGGECLLNKPSLSGHLI